MLWGSATIPENEPIRFKRRVMDAADGLPAVVRLTMLCYTARLLLYSAQCDYVHRVTVDSGRDV